MNRRGLWLLTGVGVAWGIFADFPSYPQGDWFAVAATLAGPAFVVAGAVAWGRRPENRTGRILMLTGYLWPLGSLYKYPGALTWAISMIFFWAWTVPLVYLVLTFPECRAARRRDRILLWVTAAAAFLPALGLLFDEHAPLCAGCGNENPLVIWPEPRVAGLLVVVPLVAAMPLLMAIIGRLWERWVRATVPARRVLAPVVATGSAALAALGVALATPYYVEISRQTETTLTRLMYLVVATIPFGFLIGLLRARARRARVGDLVLELGRTPSPDRFQAALRNALGDPSLVAGFWEPEEQRYRTPEGLALEPPDEGGPQVATFLDREAAPLAVIVHDPALLDDPGLVAAATAAARLAIENERLQEEVLAQLAEVRASRARIVQAGDEARRRIERDLHDGAQQRLVALRFQVQLLQTLLAEDDRPEIKEVLSSTSAELSAALDDVRDLARGIHPMILSQDGLGAALESLAERSPVRVELDGIPERRFPEAVEIAAYYVVSEALANSAKHAGASRVRVSARDGGDRLLITVEDDGIGGATIGVGTGLSGIADRIHALDGSFEVHSPPGEGTRLRAEFPYRAPSTEAEDHTQEAASGAGRHAEPDQLPPPATALLACRGICVFYGQRQVLFDVDLEVRPGEIVALLGTNGAGKSTLVRTIAGLVEPRRGSVRLGGRDLTDVSAEERRRAGLVYVEGGAGVFRGLTVEDNLRLFGRHAGNGNGRGTGDALEVFQALHRKGRQIASSLSRGEQHMLALAKGVLSGADLIVVDELSLGLSPAAVEEVHEVIRGLNESGCAVLFVEQSVKVARALTDRCYFLDAGRVVFEGSIEALDPSLLRSVWIQPKAAHA